MKVSFIKMQPVPARYLYAAQDLGREMPREEMGAGNENQKKEREHNHALLTAAIQRFFLSLREVQITNSTSTIFLPR